MDFRERLRLWVRKLTWKNFLWFLLLLPWHVGRPLLEDRFIGALNGYIDKHSNTILNILAHLARFFLTHPVSATAIIAIFIFAFLIAHAYVETRPNKINEKAALSSSEETIDLQLTPSQGPSDKQFLAVTNKGKKQKFHATCKVIKRKNDLNLPLRKIYDLAWENELLREAEISCGESRNLLIAIAEIDHPRHLEETKLIELSAGMRNTVEWSRWDRYDRSNPRPEYELEITIFGEGQQAPMAKRFILKCGGTTSALELTSTYTPLPLAVNDRNGPEVVLLCDWPRETAKERNAMNRGEIEVRVLSEVAALRVRVQEIRFEENRAEFDEIPVLEKGKPKLAPCKMETIMPSGKPHMLPVTFEAFLKHCFDVVPLNGTDLIHPPFTVIASYRDSRGVEWESVNEMKYNILSNEGVMRNVEIRPKQPSM